MFKNTNTETFTQHLIFSSDDVQNITQNSTQAVSEGNPFAVDDEQAEALMEKKNSEFEKALLADDEQGDDADYADDTDEADVVEEETRVGFDNLGLKEEVLRAVKDLGYIKPSPIQEEAIKPLMDGLDIIGQAQTGTGKTAAFALPLISKIDPDAPMVQALVLLPTRELAIQVADACDSFAKYLKKVNVLSIYGGSSYERQIRALKSGVQIVVGTPGRVMDLIERGKLDLSNIRMLVLDEADEMLKMGFIDDVEWILEKCPPAKQTALFSATMPDAIKKVAKKNLISPKEIRIAAKTATATTVRQRYWLVSGLKKIDALIRLLEVEPYDALLIFTRTKTDAEELEQKLSSHGISCDALHGDIPQKIREKVVDRLRKGQLDVLVATDVVARGLDVDRITHVINYDIPFDPESYVHRIGRTGRAGKTGDAILFVSPRERRMLRLIEKVTRSVIEPMKMPTNEDINRHRADRFRDRIISAMEGVSEEEMTPYRDLVRDILESGEEDAVTLAASLARMVNGRKPLFVDSTEPEPEQKTLEEFNRERKSKRDRSAKPSQLKDFPDLKMIRYRVAVGRKDGVKPGQIVGAVANEGDIDSRYIGMINIFDTYSTVDLPEGMPKETMSVLKKAVVCGRSLEIREYFSDSRWNGSEDDDEDSGFKSRERRRDRDSRKDFAGKKGGDHGRGRKHGGDFPEERSRFDRKEEPRGKKGRVLRGVPFKFGA